MSDTLSPLFSWRSSIVDSDLPPTARHVALTLSLHMSERGDSCFPSLSTICAETGLGKTAVCRALKAIGAAGLLQRTPGVKGRSTRYVALAGDSALGEQPSASGEHEVVKEVFKDLTPSPAAPSKGERDSVWDALEAIFGTPTTPQHRRRFGKVQRELLADTSLAAGAVAAEIPLRASRYRAKWADCELTLEALAKHWPDLRNGNGVSHAPAWIVLDEGGVPVELLSQEDYREWRRTASPMQNAMYQERFDVADDGLPA